MVELAILKLPPGLSPQKQYKAISSVIRSAKEKLPHATELAGLEIELKGGARSNLGIDFPVETDKKTKRKASANNAPATNRHGCRLASMKLLKATLKLVEIRVLVGGSRSAPAHTLGERPPLKAVRGITSIQVL